MTTELLFSSSLNEVGQRENNEDAVFPNSEIHSPLSNLFLVCDGVGGHAKGEIASDLVCSQLAKYFEQEQIEVSTAALIEKGVQFVENQFDSYMLSRPDSSGMGTTLTLLHLHKQGATLAHIGDSRIYHLREGQVMYRTKDHSYVQALVDLGEITEEEAAHHPNRNQITNAIQGASVRRAKPSVHHITDLRAGDLFILCTDGVLESVSDADFKDFSREGYEVDTIALKMRTLCQGHSRDNFSAYIVKLTEAYVQSLEPPSEQPSAAPASAPSPPPPPPPPTVAQEAPPPTEEAATPVSPSPVQEEVEASSPSFDRPHTQILFDPFPQEPAAPLSPPPLPEEPALCKNSDDEQQRSANRSLLYLCLLCIGLFLALWAASSFSSKGKGLKDFPTVNMPQKATKPNPSPQKNKKR